MIERAASRSSRLRLILLAPTVLSGTAASSLAQNAPTPTLVPLSILWEVNAKGSGNPDWTSTISSSERNNYSFLGAIAYIQADQSVSPLYRLNNGSDHMDSTTAGEGGYNTDGPLGSVWTTANAVPGLSAISRLASSQTGDHATSSPNTTILFGGSSYSGYQVQGTLGYGYQRYGNQASNLVTASGGGVTESSDSVAGGVIASWTFAGQQFIDTVNYGRYFQSDFFYQPSANGPNYNPTEAGDSISGFTPSLGQPGFWHGAPLIQNNVANGVHTTRAVPLEYGDPNRQLPISADTPEAYTSMQIGKDLTLNFQGMGAVAQYNAAIRVGNALPRVSAEVPSIYLLNSFTSFYSYDAQSKTLTARNNHPDGCNNQGIYPTPASGYGGVIIADPSTGNAMGVYGSPKSTNGNGSISYELYDITQCAATTKLGMAWVGTLNKGDNHFISYIINGSVTQVAGLMSKLYQAGY